MTSFYDKVPVNLDPIRPGRTLKQVYPHYRIDLMAAIEISEDAAWDVVFEAQRRLNYSRRLIFAVDVASIGDHAGQEYGEFIASGETRDGYYRKWIQYTHGSHTLEFIWHQHDGYGRERGTIELSVWDVVID